MARTRKSWQEKLAVARAKASAPHKFLCGKTKRWFVVPSTSEVEALLAHIPSGRLMTLAQMTEVLRERHRVDVCCPLTTGIIAWLIAHAADEAEQVTGTASLPWWRLLKRDGELNPKYPGAGLAQRRKLEAEGHRTIARGKHLFVEDWERALVAARAPRPPRREARPLMRKVLRRDDFGLCVLLPKQEWGRLPVAGPAWVEVNGRRRRAAVVSERCNCTGKGWHEHRFLTLPRSAAVSEGARVQLRIAK